jgi:CIC family chloride channel protein
MGAAFAGATRAAITAVIILFELTGEYTIILPLMLAVVTATAVSRTLSKDTIYTLKLARRGIDIDAAHAGHGRLTTLTVAPVMELLPEPLAADTPLADTGRALWLSANGVLPVMGADHRYHGCVTARVVSEALGNTESTARTAGDLAQLPPKVTANSTLADALHALAGAEGTGLPVLDPSGRSLVGWITHRALLDVARPAPEPAASRPDPAVPSPVGGLAARPHETPEPREAS